MDRILLQGMRFYGFHGLKAEEKSLGQDFVVDVELCLSLVRAGREDDLDSTVDYQEVYRTVRGIVEGKSFNLMEGLAEAIARHLLSGFPVERVLVRVKKLRPPVGGTYDWFGVEIERSRE